MGSGLATDGLAALMAAPILPALGGTGLLVAPAIGLMFVLGVWPQWVIGLFNSTVVGWISQGPG